MGPARLRSEAPPPRSGTGAGRGAAARTGLLGALRQRPPPPYTRTRRLRSCPPRPAAAGLLRPSGERRCRERRAGRPPLFPHPSAAMREREPGRSPPRSLISFCSPLVPRCPPGLSQGAAPGAAVALRWDRAGAEVPGGHGPGCSAAPGAELALVKGASGGEPTDVEGPARGV